MVFKMFLLQLTEDAGRDPVDPPGSVLPGAHEEDVFPVRSHSGAAVQAADVDLVAE